MKWASAVSELVDLEQAVGECAAGLLSRLDDAAPDLAVVFVSPHHEAGYENVSRLVKQHLPSAKVFGCSGGGIIGNGVEVEQRPAVSVTGASLPGVEIVDFFLDGDSVPDLDAGPSSWEDLVKVSSGQDPQFIILVDPFSFPGTEFVAGLRLRVWLVRQNRGHGKRRSATTEERSFLGRWPLSLRRHWAGPPRQYYRRHGGGPGDAAP